MFSERTVRHLGQVVGSITSGELRAVISNRLVTLFLCLLLTPSAVNAAQLKDIRYNAVVEDLLEIELVFDAPVEDPESRVNHRPTEIEFRFPDVTSDLDLRSIPIDKADVRGLSIQEGFRGMKMVVGLKSLRPYRTQRKGNSFIISIGNEVVAGPTPDDVFLNRINALDFRRGAEGEGQFLVYLEGQSAAVDVTQKGEKLIVEFHNTDIMKELIYMMDVIDFNTPVKTIETFKGENYTQFMVEPLTDYTYNYYQLDNLFTLTVSPISEDEDDVSDQYAGQPISLNFQDIPVRTVLQIIADYNGFNLVTTDSVDGNITLRLDGVPWDQALDIILKVKGLGKRVEGRILMIAPSEELAVREANELKAEREVKDLAPLYSEYIQVNYAKAAELTAIITSSDSSLLSKRGAVSMDERTNTLLVRDTAERLEDIRRMIDVLDVPVKQVMIEARMVTISDGVQEDLGIRWGITDTFDDGATSGTLEGADAAAAGIVPDLADRLNVNLPVASPAGSIAFQVAKLADGTILDLELSALERENKGEVIASPRITTANQKPAYIEQGTEIPFVEASSSGATSVTFKKAVLALRVTPHITPDDRIILDLVITQDTKGDTVPTGTGLATAINTQEIGTQVLVNNGETIVLGGIYQQEIKRAVSKVPLLGDLPGVGWMFRNTSDTNEKKEILIFVTPRIVTETF
ncbi:type IV pilus secretin PilQ family protein [Corallincola holothuriorum]|uniref:Type IV pilus secretin PilQ family protein n=1 Tax=Corallincola holothuriorum TaxID=2282215 RepID=A0A368N3L6_9GAMM|nr:type IV pilus secretin PilQ family protein [Corallincola holothuriorum]